MRLFRSLLVLFVAAPLSAQTALIADATVRTTPGGATVAVLKQGTTVTVGHAKGGDVYVTFTGWVDGTKLGAAKDSFPAHLTGSIAMRLRSAPSMQGVILGEIRPGAGIFTSGKQQSWANVRRGGWIDAKALPKDAAATAKAEPPKAAANAPKTENAKATAKTDAAKATKAEPSKPAKNEPAKTAAKNDTPKAAAKPEVPPAKPAIKEQAPPPAPAAEEPAVVEAMPEGAMRVSRSAVVRNAPNGLVLGQLGGGAIVEPIARSRGWVRVRADVWIPERDIVPADSSFGATLSAADLRADPEGTRGKTVRWEVQVLALQYADPLRRDLAKDEPYFLAKGPGVEDQLLYLAIPPSLINEARSTQALTRLLVTARVRTGRSQPVGIPILDILSFARQ